MNEPEPGQTSSSRPELRITAAGYTATVLSDGGGLATLEYDGHPLVAGPSGEGPVSGGRGQVLIPWPNRIRDGRYAFAGAEQQLALSEPESHNAMHGLVRWLDWQIADREADRISLECRLVPQKGYPWELQVSASYALGADGLTVTLGAVNRGETAAPFACGMHPYLDVGGRVDAARLHLSAATHVITDDRQLPVGDQPTPPELNFSSGALIGDRVLDDAFTDLVRDRDGWAVVRLEGEPESGHAVEVHLGPQWRWVQVFTGDTLAAPQRRLSMAVEPMTAPADAFNSGAGLLELAPGERWSGSYRIAFVSGPRPSAGSPVPPGL